MKKEEEQILAVLDLMGRYTKRYPKQMEQIKLAYNQKLTLKKMRLLINLKFEWQQMRIIRTAFSVYELEYEKVEVFAKPNINANLMEELMLLFVAGSSIEDVQIIIDEKITWQELREIRINKRYN